jgi:hypothetical protein
LSIAPRGRSDRALGDDSARRRGDHRQHVFVAVPVDADHVVQLVCKHLP